MSEFLPSGLRFGDAEMVIDVQAGFEKHLSGETHQFQPVTPPEGQIALAAYIDVNADAYAPTQDQVGRLWLLDIRSTPFVRMNGRTWRGVGGEPINEMAAYYLIDPLLHSEDIRHGYKAMRMPEKFVFGRPDFSTPHNMRHTGKRLRFDGLDYGVDFDHFKLAVDAQGEEVTIQDLGTENGTHIYAGQQLLAHLGIALPATPAAPSPSVQRRRLFGRRAR